MSKEAIIVKNEKGDVVATIDSTGIPKVYGSSRVTPAIGFDYPEYGTGIHEEKLDKDPLSAMMQEQIKKEVSSLDVFEWPNVTSEITVNRHENVARVVVEVESYKDQIIEINENNELVVKIGKVKLGGCK